jgi:hypothetical protein
MTISVPSKINQIPSIARIATGTVVMAGAFCVRLFFWMLAGSFFLGEPLSHCAAPVPCVAPRAPPWAVVYLASALPPCPWERPPPLSADPLIRGCKLAQASKIQGMQNWCVAKGQGLILPMPLAQPNQDSNNGRVWIRTIHMRLRNPALWSKRHCRCRR